MSANERLQKMQSALLERGVRDVKFCFSLGVGDMPKSQVESGVADVLQAYLDRRFTRVEKLGDAPIVPA